MNRLLRLPLLATVVPVLALVVALLFSGGTPVAPLREVSSSPTPPSGCHGCLQPLDAICWEGPPMCFVPLVRIPPHTDTVTAHYRTVAMTAQPGVDYVDVRSGTVMLQPGQTSAEIAIQLLPRTGPARTFGVEVFAVSGAGLVRPMATCTIKPAG